MNEKSVVFPCARLILILVGCRRPDAGAAALPEERKRPWFVWSPNPDLVLIVLYCSVSGSDPAEPWGTFAVEIELKRSAKSVIERIVNLRDSL